MDSNDVTEVERIDSTKKIELFNVKPASARVRPDGVDISETSTPVNSSALYSFCLPSSSQVSNRRLIHSNSPNVAPLTSSIGLTHLTKAVTTNVTPFYTDPQDVHTSPIITFPLPQSVSQEQTSSIKPSLSNTPLAKCNSSQFTQYAQDCNSSLQPINFAVPPSTTASFASSLPMVNCAYPISHIYQPVCLPIQQDSVTQVYDSANIETGQQKWTNNSFITSTQQITGSVPNTPIIQIANPILLPQNMLPSSETSHASLRMNTISYGEDVTNFHTSHTNMQSTGLPRIVADSQVPMLQQLIPSSTFSNTIQTNFQHSGIAVNPILIYSDSTPQVVNPINKLETPRLIDVFQNSSSSHTIASQQESSTETKLAISSKEGLSHSHTSNTVNTTVKTTAEISRNINNLSIICKRVRIPKPHFLEKS